MPFPSDLDKSGAPPFMLKDQGPTLGWLRNYNPPPDSAGVNAQFESTDGAGHITFTNQLVPVGVGWISVKSFGATGNGSTDDTAAVNSAIAAFNSAGTGVLYFSAGTYLCTAGLTPITAGGTVLGDGATASTVTCNSTTANLFTAIPNGKLIFRDLGFVNTAVTPPTAGSGISVSGGGQVTVNFQDIHMESFYIDIDSQTNSEWTMTNCELLNPVLYALKIRNTVFPDNGDWSIVGLNTFPFARNPAAAIRIESSGGGKITNSKINWGGNGKYAIGIDLVGSGVTSDFTLTNFSIENFTDRAIRIDGNWPAITISNGELGVFSGFQNFGITVNNNFDILINNITMHGEYVAASITNCTNVIVSNIKWGGVNATDGIVATGNTGLIINNILPSTAGLAPIASNSGNAFSTVNDLLGAVQGDGFATIVVGAPTAGSAFPGSWGLTSISSGSGTLLWIDANNNFLPTGIIFSLGKTEFWRTQVLGLPNNDYIIRSPIDLGTNAFTLAHTSDGDLTLLKRRLVAAAANTTRASLSIPSGVAPTSPQDGDMWYDSGQVRFRVGGTTKTFTLT